MLGGVNKLSYADIGDFLHRNATSINCTADPRGVILTHQNLMANEALIQNAFEHTSSTVVLGWLPFQHDMGLIGNVLQPVFSGADEGCSTIGDFAAA